MKRSMDQPTAPGRLLTDEPPGNLHVGTPDPLRKPGLLRGGVDPVDSPTGATTLAEVDPPIAELIAREEQRQREKIILVASESAPHPAVLEALASPFTSLYAEGYPSRRMRQSSLEQLLDFNQQLASYARHGNRRFYRGTEYADLVECIAERRTAECFATPAHPPAEIFVNVQPLSGSVANLAVYEAFVEPGETVMGMALTEGGHLTHGSPYSVTGKRYHVVSYVADPDTGRLDYREIARLARRHRPKLLISGFTSFPWQPDWERFRRIADDVNAVLLADIAHAAGLVVGGVYPNPVGLADVVTFTTHKTLCGPRGAVLLTTDSHIARRLDRAVFPGLQGGPHVNKFAAIAVAMGLAKTDAFRQLQRRIVENARFLAKGLADEGLTLAYGGTDTHLLLVDLKPLRVPGDVAARILDRVGIVCNRNVIPGDHNAGDAHGIRLGTPWVTQRRMGKAEMRELARIIAQVLGNIRSYPVVQRGGKTIISGKLPPSILDRARKDVRALVASTAPSSRSPPTTSDGNELRVLRVRGEGAGAFLNVAVTVDVPALRIGDTAPGQLLDETGVAGDRILVGRYDEEKYLVITAPDQGGWVKEWFTDLSADAVLLDEEDPSRGAVGTAVVEFLIGEQLPAAARRWRDAFDAGVVD